MTMVKNIFVCLYLPTSFKLGQTSVNFSTATTEHTCACASVTNHEWMSEQVQKETNVQILIQGPELPLSWLAS